MVHQRQITAAALALAVSLQSTQAASLRKNSNKKIEEASDAMYWDRMLQDSGSMDPTTPTPTSEPISLPEINELINIAYPMWEVDAEGRRLETKDCTVDSCEWNPFYVTKRYDGLHPDLGGHPTDNDVKYAFFGSSPFAGQPYSGTPHHCNINDPDDIKAKDCPKIKTTTDTGPDGPGHVPPHIGLASLTWAVQDNLFSLDEMFYYDFYDCRVIPDVLLKMIRNYFPRTEGVVVDYPPPIVPEGGDFQYEFPSGNGLENQQPPYAPGPPHWCTDEMLASGHWDGVCPYVFEGPDAGKYRHPHIAYAALEVYLANLAMPDKCHTTWLQNNPDFLDPNRVTTDTPFPVMSNDDFPPDSLENWLGQPVLPWTYVSDPPKAAEGTFSSAILYAPRSAEPEPIVDPPLLGSSYCTYAPDYDCWESGWPECCGSDDIECPEQQPACTKVDPLVVDPPLVGASYCTYAPDYECWESGWPECCGSEDIECPEQQPGCTKVVDTPVIPVDTPVITVPVDTPDEDTSNDTSEVDTFETPEEDEPEEDKPGKDNSKKDKPGKDNSKKDKPGKDNSKKDKPGKDNSKKDKPEKMEKPDKMDKPGKDNSKKDKPEKMEKPDKKEKPEKMDKPGKDNSKKDNSKKDKPDKKEKPEKEDKPGKDNSKKDNSKKDKPGKKDKEDEPSQAFARFFADGPLP